MFVRLVSLSLTRSVRYPWIIYTRHRQLWVRKVRDLGREDKGKTGEGWIRERTVKDVSKDSRGD